MQQQGPCFNQRSAALNPEPPPANPARAGQLAGVRPGHQADQDGGQARGAVRRGLQGRRDGQAAAGGSTAGVQDARAAKAAQGGTGGPESAWVAAAERKGRGGSQRRSLLLGGHASTLAAPTLLAHTSSPRAPSSSQRTSRTLWLMCHKRLPSLPDMEASWPLPSKDAAHISMLTGVRVCVCVCVRAPLLSSFTGPSLHTSPLLSHFTLPFFSAMDADLPRHMELYPEDYNPLLILQQQPQQHNQPNPVLVSGGGCEGQEEQRRA